MAPREKLVHAAIYIVVRPNGEHHLIEKEPLEGIQKWATGQDVTVLEYAFRRVAYPKGVFGKPVKS